MDDNQLLRYSRHILLEEVGIEGQSAFLRARALIVGAGGLGSPAALYLAAAGVGQITLADPDTVELSNLQRQIAHSMDWLHINKAVSARNALYGINPDTRVEVITERLEGDKLLHAVAHADIVLDCSDNFATRHAINRACVAHKVPLVSGAAIRFDGQVSVFDARAPASPCYHCLFPESAQEETLRCSEAGVFSPLTGIVGTLQAAETLKLLGGFGTPLTGKLLLLNALDMQPRIIRLPRDPACPVCGETGLRAEG